MADDRPFDPDIVMFGWNAPFDEYNPELPVTVVIPSTPTSASVTIAAGCKFSTLIHALQLRGMEKPGDR